MKNKNITIEARRVAETSPISRADFTELLVRLIRAAQRPQLDICQPDSVSSQTKNKSRKAA